MGDPRGRPELRDALAEYLARARGVRTSPDVDRDLRRRPACRRTVGTGRSAGPIAVEAYGLFIFRDAIDAHGGADDPDRPRRTRRGGRRSGRAGRARRAAHPGPPQPAGHAAAPVAAHRGRRMGAAHRRLRARRRLRRGVPLRPPTRRRAAGAVSRPGRLPRIDQQEPVARRCDWAGWCCPTTSSTLSSTPRAAPQFYVDAINQLTMADFIASGSTTGTSAACVRATGDAATLSSTRWQAFDVGISGLAAGLNLLLTLPEGSRARSAATRRARPASRCKACRGCAIHCRPEVADRDGIVVGFATPAEHAFAGAVEALCEVIRSSGL